MFSKQINRDAIAAIDDTLDAITYSDLFSFSSDFSEIISRRTLIFILADNTVTSLSAIVASLECKIVPLLLNPKINKQHLQDFVETYQPEYIWLPADNQFDFNYEIIFSWRNGVLLKTGHLSPKLHSDLSLLLPTSGSTGGPKLVRHSYANLEASAVNVAKIFELTGDERALLLLPLHYTMGLSIMMSHLYSGATLLLIGKSIMSKEFWEFTKEQRATSVTGVPYVFEVFKKLGFFKMDLPHMNVISQGGGKLNDKLFLDIARFAANSGKKFIATYGQTEGTGRMSYLPHSLAQDKVGSIGQAIPSSRLGLADENGNLISEDEAEGEMIFHGPTVTLGYAFNAEDLFKGDERKGILHTGDIARRDSDGFLYIAGRVSRFLKLYGIRVSLDQMERLIADKFSVNCACAGDDDKMKIYLENGQYGKEIARHVSKVTGIFIKAFEVEIISQIPRSSSGKIMYNQLEGIG